MNGYWITGLAAAVLGIALGTAGVHALDANYYGAQLGVERAARANDNRRHADELNAISKAALDAERRVIDEHRVAERNISIADAQLTKERQAHEADNSRYRVALDAGTRRLRVAVTKCSTGVDNLSGTTGTARVDDGTTTYADLDRAVAERVFRVAGDDDNEISKVKALQAYVCAVRPTTYGC
ncbi:lysis system i-spanin subunit Rz [Paraburkholderia terrae]